MMASLTKQTAAHDRIEQDDAAPVIVVDNMSKRFLLREQRHSNEGSIKSLLKNLFDFEKPLSSRKYFWALSDVNFAIRRGESVGIIGKNGSGKSTLLRVLCGMTEATRGSTWIRGKFGALFALNAGFSMELSGRKNIYLLSALYGKYRDDVDEIVDEIIEFADIGLFIDQPVKKYSSGMRSRLGFSILFHNLPDIVFIDEALTTGDGAFKQKCIDRLQGLKEEERTLVFVSHGLQQIQALCDRVIWLHKGEIVMDGPTDEVVNAYTDRFQIKRDDLS
jgi:ABC-type polysaccharide/polyol phosphate transport system ATPase subunit